MSKRPPFIWTSAREADAKRLKASRAALSDIAAYLGCTRKELMERAQNGLWEEFGYVPKRARRSKRDCVGCGCEFWAPDDEGAVFCGGCRRDLMKGRHPGGETAV